jgi:hypothetical protein
MTTIINLTPHAITTISEQGVSTTYEASGIIARVQQSVYTLGTELGGISVSVSEFGDIIDLPDSVDGTYYIVSGLVLSANKDRKDLIAPRTDNTAIRNDKGHIIAVKGWLK